MDKGRHYSLLEEPLPTHHSRSSPTLSILYPTPSTAEVAPINNVRTGNNNNKKTFQNGANGGFLHWLS